MSDDIEVGVRVECISVEGLGPGLEVGGTYTVAAISEYTPTMGPVLRTVYLEERPNSAYGLPPYSQHRFIPLTSEDSP